MSQVDPRRISPMMGRLWSPVAAVTSRWQEKSNAQIAVSISAASIVPERPRVLVQIHKDNFSWEMINQSGAFALNFLRPDQLSLIKTLGFVSGRSQDKLADLGHHFGVSGSPILNDCWGYLDCRVVNAMDGGDMTCFLADVLDGDTLLKGEPLWWRNARRRIPDEWNQEWDRKIAIQIQHSMQIMDQIDYTPWNPDGPD